MRVLIQIYTIATLAMTAINATASAQGVFVKGTSDAQGIARPTPGGCFVVTVDHAIGNSDQIGIVLLSGRHAAATVVRQHPADIAVLRVDEPAKGVCGDEWPRWSEMSNVLPPGPWEVRRIDQNGVMHRVPVVVSVDDPGRTLRVRPLRSSDSFHQGFSGSPLFADGELFGMVVRTTERDDEVTVYSLGYLTGIIGTEPPPPISLNGYWRVVRAGPIDVLDPQGTTVRVQHSVERLDVLLETPGGELGKHAVWSPGMVMWKGVLPGRGSPNVRGYGRPTIADRLRGEVHPSQIDEVIAREVPFVVVDPTAEIRTEFVFAEAVWNQSRGRVELLPRAVAVTLRRLNVYASTPSSSPRGQDSSIPDPLAEEAFQRLRQLFRDGGRYEVENASAVHRALRWRVEARSLTNCQLTILETIEGGLTLGNLYEVITENTTMSLARLDLDRITVVQGAVNDLPLDRWFVRVVAVGPAIRVQRSRKFDGNAVDEPREHFPKDAPVVFLTTFREFAENAAAALKTLARSCGAR